MVRLTADLIGHSPTYLNPLSDREVLLRGHKIPAIENTGALKNQHDTLDLTDNDIAHLSNFAQMSRLKCLLLARNRITRLAPNLATNIPNLDTLTLESNRIEELADLEPLATLTRLQHLVIADNPVARLQHYRIWVVSRCPGLRFLDFQRVREHERKEAAELFGTEGNFTQAAREILAIRAGETDGADLTGASDGVALGNGVLTAAAAKRRKMNGAGGKVELTAGQKRMLDKMVKQAHSIKELTRIEELAADGRIAEDDGGDEVMGGG